MIAYKISELLESLNASQKDGFEYVTLSILDPDDDIDCETVCLNYVCDASSTEEDMIDSVPLPDGYSNY